MVKRNAGSPCIMAAVSGMALFVVGLFSNVAFSAEKAPDYLGLFTNSTNDSPATVARRNLLSLNSAMFGIYNANLRRNQRNLLARKPVLLAMFTGGGGRMILHIPGEGRVQAPPVPVGYQLAKSAGHSTMAVYQLVAPYVDNHSNTAWRRPMQTFRAQMHAVLRSLDSLSGDEAPLADLKALLTKNIAFMDRCLESGDLSRDSLAAFARDVEPLIKRLVWYAADLQVGHWIRVLSGWKARLGDRWEEVYAASNTIYVARNKNVLFSVLAQFMGKKAINTRLMLLETMDFETTEKEMLVAMMRILADRAIGDIFFRDPYVMDVELMGDGARDAIRARATKDRPALLPPAASYGSHEWPWHTKNDGRPATLKELQE